MVCAAYHNNTHNGAGDGICERENQICPGFLANVVKRETHFISFVYFYTLSIHFFITWWRVNELLAVSHGKQRLFDRWFLKGISYWNFTFQEDSNWGNISIGNGKRVSLFVFFNETQAYIFKIFLKIYALNRKGLMTIQKEKSNWVENDGLTIWKGNWHIRKYQ